MWDKLESINRILSLISALLTKLFKEILNLRFKNINSY